MAGPNPGLSIAPTIAPASSTGSDIHEHSFDFGFGDITIGAEKTEWWQKIASQVAIGVVVAISVKLILDALRK